MVHDVPFYPAVQKCLVSDLELSAQQAKELRQFEESKTFKKTDQIRFFNWSNQFRSGRLADRRVRQTLSTSSARYDLESFPQGL